MSHELIVELLHQKYNSQLFHLFFSQTPVYHVPIKIALKSFERFIF